MFILFQRCSNVQREDFHSHAQSRSMPFFHVAFNNKYSNSTEKLQMVDKGGV